MKTIVEFDFAAPIPVQATVPYPSIDVTAKEDHGKWTGLKVELEHDDPADAVAIVESAREKLRSILAAAGVGRGLEPALGTAHFRSPSGPAQGQGRATGSTATVRQLQTMPSEVLVLRLDANHGLRSQAEALNAARAASDVVSRIRWAFMVLEQEQILGRYTPADDFRYLRHAVSHPALDDPQARSYFRSVLGVEQPNVHDSAHRQFLEAEAQRLLAEAARIVEDAFQNDRFWQ